MALLREGRCVLQNSISTVLYITLYSIIELFSVVCLYKLGTNLTDAQVSITRRCCSLWLLVLADAAVALAGDSPCCCSPLAAAAAAAAAAGHTAAATAVVVDGFLDLYLTDALLLLRFLVY